MDADFGSSTREKWINKKTSKNLGVDKSVLQMLGGSLIQWRAVNQKRKVIVCSWTNKPQRCPRIMGPLAKGRNIFSESLSLLRANGEAGLGGSNIEQAPIASEEEKGQKASRNGGKELARWRKGAGS